MLIKDFLEKVSNQIKYKPIVNEISEELTAHINEQKENYIEYGLDEIAAEERAVDNMGDGEEIGKKLNKIHKPRLDIFSLVLTFILIGFGILIAFIKSERMEMESYFSRVIITFIVGLVLSIGIYFFDYRKIAKYSNLIYIFSSILCIFAILVGCTVSGGRWIRIFGLSFSTIYICTYLYIIAFAGFFGNYDKQNNIELKIHNKTFTINKDLLKIFIFAIISLFLIGAIGKIAMFVLTCITYLIFATRFFVTQKRNISKSILVFVFFIALVAIILLVSNNEYYLGWRIQRIFNAQELDPKGDGFLNNQLEKTLENSKWFSSLEDKEYFFGLFDGGNVTALTTITVYCGKFFSVIIILSLILLSLKLIYNTKQIKDNYGKMIVIGLSSIILLQAFINVLINLNIIGFMDISLPFVSYGINGLLINMMSLALILSVYRRKDINLRTLKDTKKKLSIKISYE